MYGRNTTFLKSFTKQCTTASKTRSNFSMAKHKRLLPIKTALWTKKFTKRYSETTSNLSSNLSKIYHLSLKMSKGDTTFICIGWLIAWTSKMCSSLRRTEWFSTFTITTSNLKDCSCKNWRRKWPKELATFDCAVLFEIWMFSHLLIEVTNVLVGRISSY